MKENETIVEMITRFTDIVNGLEALGKTYKESEKVMKILRVIMTYEINLAKKLQEGRQKEEEHISKLQLRKKKMLKKKNQGSKKDKWFLDSGCSRHMTGDESKFAFLTKRKEDTLPLETMQKEGSLVKATLAWRPPWENYKLKIEGNKKKLERIPRKKNHLGTTPPQQVQGESSQDLPKDWKFVINHPQDQIIVDENWMIAMQEELNQFERSEVWELVPRPSNQSVIGTRWVFRNKMDENGIIVRNKARLVAQGFNQEEGIDYEETLSRS
ncbi:putative mitochondrial protein [Vitis vinifera]|uniref:Putative mitochondrial protein n=1 Tax=Vitis vinifera TaxID=29760 RepID=A0A438C8D2_VITVI|nr:putative mitochondrial protein [Vitis vinifera]